MPQEQQQQQDFLSYLKSMGRGDQLIGGGAILLLIGMFLPWLSSSCSGDCAFYQGASEDGFHGWGWVTFFAVLAILGLVVIRNFFSREVPLGDLALTDAQIFMIGGAITVAGNLLFWLEYHSDLTSATIGNTTVSAGLGFGWFWSVIAGILIIVGGYLKMQQGDTGTGAGYSPSATGANYGADPLQSGYAPPVAPAPRPGPPTYGPPPAQPPGAPPVPPSTPAPAPPAPPSYGPPPAPPAPPPYTPPAPPTPPAAPPPPSAPSYGPPPGPPGEPPAST